MTAQDARQPEPEAGSNLALMKGIVIALGVVILLGIGVIVVTIVNRMAGLSGDEAAPAGQAPATQAGPVAPFGTVGIAAAPGSRIAAAAAGDGIVLLTLSGGGEPDRVVVIDAATGQERGRFQVEAPPAGSPGTPPGAPAGSPGAPPQ